MTRQVDELTILEHIFSFWYRRRDEISLSQSESLLYLALLFISNRKTSGVFKTEIQFPASIPELRKETGSHGKQMSQPTILKARKRLKELNLIDYFDGSGGTTCAVYTIKHLDKYYISSKTQPLKKVSSTDGQPLKKVSRTTKNSLQSTTNIFYSYKDIDKDVYREIDTHTFSSDEVKDSVRALAEQWLQSIIDKNGSVTLTQAKIQISKLVEAVDRHGFEKAKKNYDMAMCKTWDYVDDDKLSNDSEQRPDRPSGSVIKTLN